MNRTSDRNEDAAARRVRSFYEGDGWRWFDGASGDARRWGAVRGGPITRTLDRLRTERARRLLALDPVPAAGPSSVVELGGGGNPALQVLAGAGHYTGVDFSGQGLRAAAAVSAHAGLDARFVEADVRSLPLGDERFAVAFSAHMIYHLPSAHDQEAALREMARVVAPGGALGVVTAEPYPWLFPGRCLRRAVARAPLVGAAVERLRPPPPLPYLPTSPRWMARVLSETGAVSLYPFGVATTTFNRRMGEESRRGRLAWRALSYLELRRPRLARALGCYTLVVLRKPASPGG